MGAGIVDSKIGSEMRGGLPIPDRRSPPVGPVLPAKKNYTYICETG